MRRFASFLLLGIALSAGATDIWRWKDANGVVHYSDSPTPGAQRMNIGSTAPPAPSDVRPAGTVAAPSAEPPAPIGYTRCVVTQPTSDQVFFAVDSVEVSVDVTPGLQGEDRLQVLLNGAPYAAWPENAQSATLTGLNRGSYTLSVRVVDKNGRTQCSGKSINFHVRQASVLSPQSPQRKPPGK